MDGARHASSNAANTNVMWIPKQRAYNAQPYSEVSIREARIERPMRHRPRCITRWLIARTPLHTLSYAILRVYTADKCYSRRFYRSLVLGPILLANVLARILKIPRRDKALPRAARAVSGNSNYSTKFGTEILLIVLKNVLLQSSRAHYSTIESPVRHLTKKICMFASVLSLFVLNFIFR